MVVHLLKLPQLVCSWLWVPVLLGLLGATPKARAEAGPATASTPASSAVSFAPQTGLNSAQQNAALLDPALSNPALLDPALTASTLPLAPIVAPIATPTAAPTAALITPDLPELGKPDKFLPAADLLTQVRLVIKLSDRRVYIYSRNQLKTSFPVAIGRDGWETPVGQHQVINMQPDPIWQHPFTGELVPPGKDNPLGSRWIGFWTDGINYIGFHGTPNEESVGHPASHGCVRMYNQDVVKLFEMVRLGTPVEVIP